MAHKKKTKKPKKWLWKETTWVNGVKKVKTITKCHISWFKWNFGELFEKDKDIQ